MAVFDLRGTHGSGKSHIVHTLLGEYGNESIIENGVLIGHVMPRLQCAVVGPYNKVCGGCDAIKTQDEVQRRVRLFNTQYPRVLLEGSLVGHTYRRYAEFADELSEYTFMFLDTPLNICISRVLRRRKARGNLKPLNTKNIEGDHRQTQTNVRRRFEAAGYHVVGISWRTATAQVASEIMRSAD